MSTDLKQRISALTEEQRRLLAQRLAGRSRVATTIPAVPRRQGRAERLPLSFAQQRLWFLDRVSPLNLAFAVTEMNRLSGALDVSVLERSLNEIVCRHEVLRTVFTVVDGEPSQHVLASLPITVGVSDLRGEAAADREKRAAELVSVAQAQPWSLETGPLVRAHVWHLAADDHIVLIQLHHIVSDGWSKNIVIRELATLFQAFSEGKPSPLPELPVQYGDFAAWEREWVTREEARASLEYWKRHMAGAPVLQLPRDHVAHDRRPTSGFHRRMWIPGALKQGVKALSQRENATPFMTLFAAFALLLSRYSGQDDIVVGSPFANRRVREVEDLIGCFMNPLPLRVHLDGNPTFRDLLRRVRDVALGAYAHQGAPFDLVVRTVERRRDAGAAPLFQVLFLLQNFDWKELELSGSELGRRSGVVNEDYEVGDEEIPGDLAYPVALEIVDLGERLFATFEYAPEFARVFAHVTAHFRALLEAVVVDPDIRIDEVPIMSPGQRRALLDAAGHKENYDIQPVHRLFETQVARTPERTAVVARGRRISYAELNGRANQLARYLVARGVAPEVPVGIVLDRSIEAVVAVLAVMKAGGVYLPLDPGYSSERQSFVLQDAGARTIVTTSSQAERFLESLLPPGAAPEFTTVCLDLEGDRIAEEEASNLETRSDVGNLAYLIYTSGSTGKPKGTMVSQGSLANAFFAWREAYRLDDVRSHLQMASISFDVFSGDLVRALCSGGRLVIAPQESLFSPADLYRLMRDEQVDCAEFVPAVVRGLAKHVRSEGESLDFLRLLIVGSDSWYAAEYASLVALCGPQTRVINSYGVSEATIDSSWFESAALDLPSDAVLPIGRSFANTRLYVVDDTLQLALPGVVGELCIGGPGLARGYLNRPDLTAGRFVPNPFAVNPGERLYRTGDLARVLADGQIELLGRIDTQVKLRGFRIEVGEIESVLAQHAEVTQSVVVLREDTPGDKRLVAYVVAAADSSITGPQLRRFAREKLPEYMVPSAIVRLPALPLLPNGKLDRRSLPAPEGQRQSEEAFVAPTNEMERGIAEVWKELLHVETVGVHDNFFDLGGHSLLVIQLHSRLRQKLGRDLTVLDLFVHPTIHSLAATLADPQPATVAEFDVARDRAARQREAIKRRRLASEAKGAAR